MNSVFRFFGLLLVCLFVISAQAGQGEETAAKTDPALEAVEALGLDAEEEAAAEDPLSETPVPAGETMQETGPDIGMEEEMSVIPLEEETPLLKDVFLVLDNSGSMKQNDPRFLAKTAVDEFIGLLDDSTRVGIIIFDQTVRQPVPLTGVSDATRQEILQNLDQINYKGQFTDSPAAIERAIYDLKLSGREDARKVIVFMTDGIVDTGNADQDLEKARWLKNDLAADAAESEIHIFGIAFTEDADFQLIQSLAQQTGGEYYRALQPEDLQNVFERIHTIMNKRPEPEPEAEPEPEPEPAPPPPPPQEVKPPEPVIIEVPVQQKGMDEEERMRSMMILAALAVLIIAVIIMVFMLIRGSRNKAEEVEAQEAFLNDVNGYTEKSTYKLGNKPIMIGRVAGKDREHLNYIVIPESTIGRRHALIEYKDFSYWIIDQGSINGTFVNDELITSETRLKHGDKVRFHKFEFEFLMPEMVDAGMTVVSNTVFGGAPKSKTESEDVTVAREGKDESEEETFTPESDDDLPEPDFDLSTDYSTDSSEQETYVREESDSAEEEKETTDEEGEDETIMLDDEDEDITEAPYSDETIRPDNDEDFPDDKK